MYQISQITQDALQTQILITPEGYQIGFTIQFVQMQAGWFMQSLTYLNFVLENVRITNLPNILYQFRGQIPFGLACFSDSDREPSLIGDFANGYSKLYILTPAEVQGYVEFLSA